MFSSLLEQLVLIHTTILTRIVILMIMGIHTITRMGIAIVTIIRMGIIVITNDTTITTNLFLHG